MRIQSFVIGLIIALSVFVTACSSGAATDAIAKCLSERGMVMYASYDCSACKAQKNYFGEAMKYINYIECGPLGGPVNEVCVDEEIQYYPTWKLGDEVYTGAKNPELLAEIAGCEV